MIPYEQLARHEDASQDLRAAADRLVEDLRDLPPGSVLRCFFRSVRATVRDGWPPSQVVPEAERRTRELLARRRGDAEEPSRRAGPGVDVPPVPRPRRER